MNRQPGYYWVKARGLIVTGWAIAEWHDDKGSIYLDGFWNIGTTMFGDSEFTIINETRILSPDEVQGESIWKESAPPAKTEIK